MLRSPNAAPALKLLIASRVDAGDISGARRLWGADEQGAGSPQGKNDSFYVALVSSCWFSPFTAIAEVFATGSGKSPGEVCPHGGARCTGFGAGCAPSRAPDCASQNEDALSLDLSFLSKDRISWRWKNKFKGYNQFTS